MAPRGLPEEKPLGLDQMIICISRRYFNIWPRFTKAKFHKLEPERMHLKTQGHGHLQENHINGNIKIFAHVNIKNVTNC